MPVKIGESHVGLDDVHSLADQVVAWINPTADGWKVGVASELGAEEAFRFSSPAVEGFLWDGLVVDRARDVNGNIVTFAASVKNWLHSFGLFGLESLLLHESRKDFGE